jgi:hypothetical protein
MGPARETGGEADRPAVESPAPIPGVPSPGPTPAGPPASTPAGPAPAPTPAGPAPGPTPVGPPLASTSAVPHPADPADPALPADGPGEALISLRHVAKAFGAVQAIADGAIELYAGEAHGLVGENGAGKSTMVKILAGVHQPDSGTLLMDGRPITLHGPAAARDAGIAVIYQEPTLFPHLTVAENIFMGRQPLRTGRRIDIGRCAPGQPSFSDGQPSTRTQHAATPNGHALAGGYGYARARRHRQEAQEWSGFASSRGSGRTGWRNTGPGMPRSGRK